MNPSTNARSRRGSTRRLVQVPCQAVRERDFKLVADRTLDVSSYGMLLPMLHPVLTGDAIIVSFPIPGTWIDAEATVTRVVHGRRPGDEGLAVGIAFDVMAPGAKAALAAFLFGQPPPLPRRGPLGRMRRGEGIPRLADEERREAPRPRVSRSGEVGVDGLGVLRALVGAWRSLGDEIPER